MRPDFTAYCACDDLVQNFRWQIPVRRNIAAGTVD
jgi:hypothetical protein